MYFKIFNGSGPPYLAQNFTRASKSHSHYTRSSSFNFFVPSVIGIASKSFYYNAILDWSALPPQIQAIGSKLEFKKAVKKHLDDNAQWQDSAEFVMCVGLLSHVLFCLCLLLDHSHLLLFRDPIGNKPAHVAGLYGLSWPFKLQLFAVFC